MREMVLRIWRPIAFDHRRTCVKHSRAAQERELENQLNQVRSTPRQTTRKMRREFIERRRLPRFDAMPAGKR